MVLYAGPLQMLYERGFLRYIRYQESEILRMMYFALRDENWDTLDHVITHEEKEITWETFRIHYKSVNRKDNEDLIQWDCLIEGTPDSNVRFTIAGKVLKDLKKNRAGFCILHPLGVTGQTAQITETDGSVKQGNFPIGIAPQNPFKNVKKLKWNFANRGYELSFEGDVFETEDQRNWIDASFKTFCTPSDLPIPVSLKAGDTIFQKVHFRPLEKLHPITSHESTIIHLTKTETRTSLPAVGIGLPGNFPKKKETTALLNNLKLDHVNISVTPSEENWITRFSQDCEFAYAIGAPIDVSIFLSRIFPEELDQFIQLVLQNRLNISSVTLLNINKPVTDQAAINLLSNYKNKLPGVKWGAGTNSDFKEINRNRIDSSGLDFVTFGAHPQVHATDDRTIIENIAGIRETGVSAAQIYTSAIHIAPTTLQSASAPKSDPRQKTEIAALWAFGCLRAAAEGNVKSVTMFETHGDNGIISNEGTPFPCYSTLEKVLRFRNHEMVVLQNTEPLLIDAMLFTNDHSTTLLLVNNTDDLQTVKYGRNEFQVLPNQLHEVNLSSA